MHILDIIRAANDFPFLLLCLDNKKVNHPSIVSHYWTGLTLNLLCTESESGGEGMGRVINAYRSF